MTRDRDGEEWVFVGSETECACLVSSCTAVRSWRLIGLDLDGTKGDGVAAKCSIGVGGHKGLLGSVMGLEIVSLSMVELERLKLDLPFLLIESVSLVMVRLVNEKARVPLVRDVLELRSRGGVFSPMGTRSSTSLFDRLSDRIASSPSMVAPDQVIWSRACVMWGGMRGDGLTFVVINLIASRGVQVKAGHRMRSLWRAKWMFVDMHASGSGGDQGPSTQPFKVC